MDATHVLLGSFSEYTDFAKLEGFTYFDKPTDVCRTLSETGGGDLVWTVNKQFLDSAISAGKNFVVVLGEDKNVDKYLTREIEYLLEHGYKLVDGIYIPSR